MGQFREGNFNGVDGLLAVQGEDRAVVVIYNSLNIGGGYPLHTGYIYNFGLKDIQIGKQEHQHEHDHCNGCRPNLPVHLDHGQGGHADLNTIASMGVVNLASGHRAISAGTGRGIR
ncbi:hypothetical protein SDC9_159719 [bioreactor metagenome]|uniref:Uncharacterized protein n=1 Tax=bioreactor metagenome TaxID=1076179 RepID=A0A645FDE9_9ZZZZ